MVNNLFFCLHTTGTYLSITFLVAATSSASSHLIFTVGFFLYSLVPAVRLLLVTNFVDQALTQMGTARHKLFEMEEATARDLK